MKKLVAILFIIVFFCTCNKKIVNERSLSICKSCHGTIMISIMSSFKIIKTIKTKIKGDTLFLSIYTGKGKQEFFPSIYLNNVKYVSTGSIIYNVEDIPNCEKVYYGKEGLKLLKELE